MKKSIKPAEEGEKTESVAEPTSDKIDKKDEAVLDKPDDDPHADHDHAKKESKAKKSAENP